MGMVGCSTRRWGRAQALPLLLLLLAGCESRPTIRAERAPVIDTTVPPGTVVDSILPIEEEIRRFRLEAPAVPTGLSGGAPTRDSLMRGWVQALERADTAAIGAMLMTSAEFITLYYPDSKFTRPPYRQGPRLLWFLMATASSQGAGRVLERHGGQPFGLVSYACRGAPERIGAVQVWSNCVVRREVDGVRSEMRFFGGIVEHMGRFKFLTYASDY